MSNLSLRNIWLVAKREYLVRVRTKSFLILTLLAPAIMAFFAIGPSAIMLMGSSRAKTVVLVTADQQIAERIKGNLEKVDTTSPKDDRGNRRPGLAQYKVELSSDLSPAGRSALEARLESKDIDGFIWLDTEAISNRNIPYITRGATGFTEGPQIRNAVRDVFLNDLLKGKGFNDEEIASLTKGYSIQMVRHSPGNAKGTNEGARFISVFFLGFFMYMTTLMYGMNVMRSVMEEKSSKIMEVLMASLNTSELLAGKILGVAAVGLTQVAIWLLMGLFAALGPIAVLAEGIRGANFSLMTGIYFLVFFLLGYLLYSSMFASIGSIVNSEQEAQQIQFFVMLPIMLSFFFSLYAITSPSDPKAVVVSLIPFATPMVMYTRIIAEMPPMWQILLSIFLTAFTAVAVTWLSSRIYRIGVLMYGKRPTLPEILKWLRYS
jgi:ABC-2 type transport system permease protein